MGLEVLVGAPVLSNAPLSYCLLNCLGGLEGEAPLEGPHSRRESETHALEVFKVLDGVILYRKPVIRAAGRGERACHHGCKCEVHQF